MVIKEAVFAGSSRRVVQKPELRLPEIAFIGRSNVGKSSLINMLCGKKGLAHTSSTPGKTQLINHFLINDSWYLVDLPGYGYAKLGKEGREELACIIDDYVLNSEELVILFILLDSRHDIQKIDLEFLNRMGEEGVPVALIYTKSDKMGVNVLKSQMEKNSAVLAQYWEPVPDILVSSSETGSGRDEILNYISSIFKTLQNK